MIDPARIVCDWLNASGLGFRVSATVPGMVLSADWTGVGRGTVIICGDASCHVRRYGPCSRATLSSRDTFCRRFLFADPSFFDGLYGFIREGV